jgi:hypothetical protein
MIPESTEEGFRKAEAHPNPKTNTPKTKNRLTTPPTPIFHSLFSILQGEALGVYTTKEVIRRPAFAWTSKGRLLCLTNYEK